MSGEAVAVLLRASVDNPDRRLRAGSVTRALAPVFDDLALAKWFARPNQRLHGAMPIDAIEHDQPFVLQAARAEWPKTQTVAPEVAAKQWNQRARSARL